MNKYFRFGMPIGSAVIVTAMLHWFAAIRLITHTLDAFFPKEPQPLGTEDYITIGCSFLSFILTVLLWTQVIFQGNRRMGIFWFAVAILNCTIQTVQSCYDLSYLRQHSPSREFYGTLWGLFVSVLANIYVFIVAAQMVSSYMVHDELTSYREILRPVGARCNGIFEYYQGNPRLGARVFLTADAIWSAYVLLAFELPTCDFSRFYWLQDFCRAGIYFFSGTAASIIPVEEIYMRIFRVLIGIIGCYLISKRAANLKPWLFSQLCGIATSVILYIILFALTKEWASDMSGYIYQFLFTCDIAYRFVVLHFCIEFKRDLDMISLV